MKKCSICEIEKDINEFYTNGKTIKGTIKYKPYCKSCELNKRLVDHWCRIKEILQIDKIRCELCGYSTNLAAIEFHHLDEDSKEYTISRMKNFSKDKLEKELEKCAILCANCHREYHNEHMNQNKIFVALGNAKVSKA